MDHLQNLKNKGITLAHYIQHLDLKSIINLCSVNSAYMEDCNDPSMWKYAIFLKFGTQSTEADPRREFINRVKFPINKVMKPIDILSLIPHDNDQSVIYDEDESKYMVRGWNYIKRLIDLDRDDLYRIDNVIIVENYYIKITKYIQDCIDNKIVPHNNPETKDYGIYEVLKFIPTFPGEYCYMTSIERVNTNLEFRIYNDVNYMKVDEKTLINDIKSGIKIHPINIDRVDLIYVDDKYFLFTNELEKMVYEYYN